MPIIFGGTTVEKVVFGGTEVDKVVFNGVTVFESKPQLATPQNVTANGTNVSWDEVENATSYEVLADGASIGTVTPSTGETWVLKESSAKWGTHNFTANFTSNSTSFTTIMTHYPALGDEDIILYNSTVALNSAGDWTNQTYRTLTFETAPTGDLLTWLQANGVKQ